MNILFRADASSSIGTGHIMRDLVLAQQYPSSKIFFATQELKGNLNSKILESGHEVISLLSNNIEELIELINRLQIEMVIIDHYSINYEFEKELKERTNIKLMVFDDTYEKHYCDVLLNHNIYAEERRYKDLVPLNCEIKCGSKYTLLRTEFLNEKRNIVADKERNNIFISIGGTDHSHININILESIKEFNFTIDLVTTSANQNLDELQTYCEKYNNINLHVNSQEIARLINYSKFTIITPSVIANEVTYLNRPIIAIQTAYNQDDMYKYFMKNNILALKKFENKQLVKLVKEVLNG